MRRYRVLSGAIRSLGFDEDTAVLEVEFAAAPSTTTRTWRRKRCSSC